MIYLDNAATTAVCTESAEAVKQALKDFYNPSALYSPSLEVNKSIENARIVLSEYLACSKSEVFFTSCATESNNWVFFNGIKNKKGNIVVSGGEHASVYECAMRLKNSGADVRFVSLDKNGTISEKSFENFVDENTSFVSVIHCSNETGAINDISALCKIAKSKAPRCIFHSDGVQALAKINANVKTLNVDLYSVSAHKIGGLKGIGALYIKSGLSLAPLLCGGGQEKGLRSGTENLAGICSFGSALNALKKYELNDGMYNLRNEVKEIILKAGNIKVNGDEFNSGYILSLSILGIKAEILQHILCDKGILIGLGSACASKSRGNRVLSAMSIDKKYIEGSIRISFFYDTQRQQAIYAANEIVKSIKELRGKING